MNIIDDITKFDELFMQDEFDMDSAKAQWQSLKLNATQFSDTYNATAELNQALVEEREKLRIMNQSLLKTNENLFKGITGEDIKKQDTKQPHVQTYDDLFKRNNHNK